jgi:hypothetical protein
MSYSSYRYRIADFLEAANWDKEKAKDLAYRAASGKMFACNNAKQRATRIWSHATQTYLVAVCGRGTGYAN